VSRPGSDSAPCGTSAAKCTEGLGRGGADLLSCLCRAMPCVVTEALGTFVLREKKMAVMPKDVMRTVYNLVKKLGETERALN
jgi:hypothetical protein